MRSRSSAYRNTGVEYSFSNKRLFCFGIGNCSADGLVALGEDNKMGQETKKSNKYASDTHFNRVRNSI